MVLQLDFNKWWLSPLEKLDKLYINYELYKVLQRSNIDFI